MITEEIKVYDGALIHKRFAYNWFRDHTLPIGNILIFRAPMDVTVDNMIDQEDVLQNDYIWSDDAINMCWEIPNMCPIGAVAYQRLFNTQVANILSNRYLKKPIELDGDDLMVHDKFLGSDNKEREVGKCSVSITYSRNNVAIGHTAVNISAGRKAPGHAYSTNLSDEDAKAFMNDVMEMYYAINDDMFIASTKVDF